MQPNQGKPFRDLTIVGVNRELCRFTESGVFRLHLQLSDFPPPGWGFAFGRAWEEVDYPLKVRAGTEGETLWVECMPADLRPHHLDELTQAMARANEYFHATPGQKSEQDELEEATDDFNAQIDELDDSFAPPLPREPVRRRSWWKNFVLGLRKP